MAVTHHSIRHSRIPRIRANLTALSFTEPESLPLEVLHHGNRNFRPFLLQWPWAWPDDLNKRTWPVFPGAIPDVQIWTFYVKAFDSYRLTDRQTDRQTDKQTDRQTEIRPRWYITSLCEWSNMLSFMHIIVIVIVLPKNELKLHIWNTFVSETMCRGH